MIRKILITTALSLALYGNTEAKDEAPSTVLLLEEANEKINQAESNIDKCVKTLKKTLKELNPEKNEQTELEKKNAELKEENEELNTQIDNLRKICAELTERLLSYDGYKNQAMPNISKPSFSPPVPAPAPAPYAPNRCR